MVALATGEMARRAHCARTRRFRLIASGRSNAEIAQDLYISDTTVKTHVKRVLMKLGLRDRIHAVIFGYESGLAQPGSKPTT